MDKRINGATSLYGVIGSPITHSLSPAIYNFLFDYYGINAVYMAFPCEREDVRATLDAVRRLNILGLNVTMPCKQAVFENVDKLGEAAEFAGAVNTVVNENGQLTGHITDGMGVVSDLLDHGVDIKDKRIVLLGVGGAGSAIMIQAALDGAKSLRVFNRSLDKLSHAEEIGSKMNAKSIGTDFSFNEIGDERTLTESIMECDILINATSMGMSPNEDTMAVSDTIVSNAFHKDMVVYDVVYNPLVTKLMKMAEKAGAKKVIGGKGMLMWQAAGAFKYYTGKDIPALKLKQYLDIA